MVLDRSDRVAEYVCEERWEDLLDLIARLEAGTTDKVFMCELEALRQDGREYLDRQNELRREDSE